MPSGHELSLKDLFPKNGKICLVLHLDFNRHYILNSQLSWPRITIVTILFLKYCTLPKAIHKVKNTNEMLIDLIKI